MTKTQMIKKATCINLTQKQREILEKMSNATHIEQHYKNRATIILKAASGISNRKMSIEMNIDRSVPMKWRNRWAYASKYLGSIEKEEPNKLLEKIKEVLSDEHRSGKKPIFTPEQVACIIDLSLQSPESVGIPVTHWTKDLLRDKTIELGIVQSISSSQILRFLKRSGSKATSI
ncbi:MAG: hypothetical protein BWY74_00944 [Firmicutes bacterium ADurb.Bin419]|nr:MAG: hypothetical protein BWY74_00944 [Firmicutes bacterium ADurb.Bin419]